MLKRDEVSQPNSCFNCAFDDELVFVLLGRDAAAPYAIRMWTVERERLGLNRPDDSQIVWALDVADAMERQHPEVRARLNVKG